MCASFFVLQCFRRSGPLFLRFSRPPVLDGPQNALPRHIRCCWVARRPPPLPLAVYPVPYHLFSARRLLFVFAVLVALVVRPPLVAFSAGPSVLLLLNATFTPRHAERGAACRRGMVSSPWLLPARCPCIAAGKFHCSFSRYIFGICSSGPAFFVCFWSSDSVCVCV